MKLKQKKSCSFGSGTKTAPSMAWSSQEKRLESREPSWLFGLSWEIVWDDELAQRSLDINESVLQDFDEAIWRFFRVFLQFSKLTPATELRSIQILIRVVKFLTNCKTRQLKLWHFFCLSLVHSLTSNIYSGLSFYDRSFRENDFGATQTHTQTTVARISAPRRDFNFFGSPFSGNFACQQKRRKKRQRK